MISSYGVRIFTNDLRAKRRQKKETKRESESYTHTLPIITRHLTRESIIEKENCERDYSESVCHARRYNGRYRPNQKCSLFFYRQKLMITNVFSINSSQNNNNEDKNHAHIHLLAIV